MYVPEGQDFVNPARERGEWKQGRPTAPEGVDFAMVNGIYYIFATYIITNRNE